MELSRPEYWSGLPFPSPAHLLDPGIEPRVPCIAGGFFTICATLVFLVFHQGRPISAEANALAVVVQSLTNTLGKCQFVVDSQMPICS